jgi:spermidine synthase
METSAIILLLCILLCLFCLCKCHIVKYKVEGTEVFQFLDIDGKYENSRFDYVTKKAVHWYARCIVDGVLRRKKSKDVLVLGVALGGIIIDLLNSNKECHVTGVDISDDNFDIVEKYSDIGRLRLVKENAETYIGRTNEIYDIIICDIYPTSLNNGTLLLPPFVLTDAFLSKIDAMLPSGGAFFLDTIDEDPQRLLSVISHSFTNVAEILMMQEDPKSNNVLIVYKAE